MNVLDSRRITIIACLVWLASPTNAYAYIDPGSGSFIFQMLIAGLLATAFKIKTIWVYIKSFFKRKDKNQVD